MKTSVHLYRSNGYRELGMYDESILELEEIEEAKKYVKRAIKADSSHEAKFLDDPAFDPVWESFGLARGCFSPKKKVFYLFNLTKLIVIKLLTE